MLRKAYVPCQYTSSAHVACHYAVCRMLNSRNVHVFLSILGVKRHSSVCIDPQPRVSMREDWPSIMALDP